MRIVETLPRRVRDDGKDLIAWIATQPWCTGKVGMIGSSWGGFNSLQIATLRPPALAAIVTNCSTDDRYADDMHYMGGCVLRATRTHWLLSADLDAWEGDVPVFSRHVDIPIARDLV